MLFLSKDNFTSSEILINSNGNNWSYYSETLSVHSLLKVSPCGLSLPMLPGTLHYVFVEYDLSLLANLLLYVL